MGSSLHFDSSTFLYILCQRQNLIVDSILRFIQYPLYVQWAIGLVKLCPKTIKIKIYIDLPLSYLDRKFNSKAGLFPSFVKSARFQVPKNGKKTLFNANIHQNGGLHVCLMRLSLLGRFKPIFKNCTFSIDFEPFFLLHGQKTKSAQNYPKGCSNKKVEKKTNQL